MIFVPPVGKESPLSVNGTAEDSALKVGEVLQGRVVRRAGDRTLFMDIGRQLRIKIHWELPFDVKPGEILSFEVISDDPPVLKLVEPDSQSPVQGEGDSPLVKNEGGERLSWVELGESPPKVTYGPPLRAKVVQQEAVGPMEPTPSGEHAATAPIEDGSSVPAPKAGVDGQPLVVEGGMSEAPVESQVAERLAAIFSQAQISESALALLRDEPFFSLYGEGTVPEDALPSEHSGGLKSLLVKGLGEEGLTILKEVFQGGDTTKILGLLLLKVVQELAVGDTTAPQVPDEVLGDQGAGELHQVDSNAKASVGAEQGPSRAGSSTGEKGMPGVAVTLQPDPVEPEPPSPSHTALLSPKGGGTEAETDQTVVVAEHSESDVPFFKGGERLAIRIWPATSRFTIDASTQPPPGLELDVGDMLQGKVMEVEGNKVIIDFGSFETQATWDAAHTVKPGATIKVMVASLLPQLRLRLVDDAPLRGFMAKLGSMKGWGELFSKLQGVVEHLPLVQADKGEGVLMRTLKGFMANSGLSTEARMAKVVEGELPPDELKNDLKLQLAKMVARGGGGGVVDAAKELLQSIGGHQLLNAQTLDSGFFVVPLVVSYQNRIDEWRMTVSQDDAEGEHWFRLTLLSSPPEIGTIRIDLTYAQKARRLEMLFWVEREESKDLVEDALPLLKEDFSGAKVNLARVEVGVSRQLSKEDLPIEVKRPYLLQTRA